MPIEANAESRLDYASLELFLTLGDIKLNDVEVILKSAEVMYEAYLKS